jgi:acetylornithine deacetylase
MVAAEPTSMNVIVAHKGVVRWRCHTKGRAAHSSYPERGDNAIYTMGHVVNACEQYATTLSNTTPHPQLGTPTLNVGLIHGGICVNAVPDRCTIEIDRRLLPDEDPRPARQQAIDGLDALLAKSIVERVEHDEPFLGAPGLSATSNGLLAEQVRRASASVGYQPKLLGVPYATDAPFFAQLGIPTVVFGPGNIEQAHTADEWIELQQLRAAVDAYYLLATAGQPHQP